MLFASLRVVFPYCIGGTLVVHLSAFDAAVPLEIPTGQRAWSDVGMHRALRHTIVWNATAVLLCFAKQDLRPAIKSGDLTIG